MEIYYVMFVFYCDLVFSFISGECCMDFVLLD